MNARQYRTEYSLSPLDFPSIMGLGATQLDYRTEPPVIINNKVKLKITKTFILVESYENKRHEVLTAVSVYEIPVSDIKEREVIYECYKDATALLNEAYGFAKSQDPRYPNIFLPTPPIENYQQEIDGVFHLIHTLN